MIAKIVPRFRASYTPRETYLTPEQFSRLLDAIVAPPSPNAKSATIAKIETKRIRRTLYVLLIALASPRRGELEKPRWELVDLAGNMIRIPKGKTKPRVVPIHPALRPWLEAMHSSAGPVVTPWGNDKRELACACERAGVPRVTPNDLRRTFATWLKQNDVDSAVVAAMMGHSSTAMVDRVYGKPRRRELPAWHRQNARRGRFCGFGDGFGLTHRWHVDRAYRWRTWHAWLDGAESRKRRFRRGISAFSEFWGEGRRTRTFNQRIKSPMLYH